MILKYKTDLFMVYVCKYLLLLELFVSTPGGMCSEDVVGMGRVPFGFEKLVCCSFWNIIIWI